MKNFTGYLKLKLGDSYVLLAGGNLKSINDFFYHKGYLYQNHNWDADTLSVGSWSFKSAGYGNVGSGAAHAHCLSENSIIEVFRNVLLSSEAWSDLLSYRVAWDTETSTARPNRWSSWQTIARISDLPTKSSWNYDDIYSKLGHNHDSSYVASVSISGDNLRINKNGTNTDLTIPYATNTDTVDGYHYNNLPYLSKSSSVSNYNTWNDSDYGFSFWGPNHTGISESYGTSLNFRDPSTTWYYRLMFGTGGRIYYRTAINTTSFSNIGTIAYLSDIPTKSSWNYDDRYITDAGNGSGNYVNNLYYTKNGSNNYFTVNYASTANTANHLKLTLLTSSNNLNSISNGYYYYLNLDNPSNHKSYNSALILLEGRAGYDKFQLEFGANEERIWFRKASDNSWTGWKTIAWTSDIPSIPSTYDWSAITNKPETATRWPSWSEVTSKPDIWDIQTITKSLTPTTSWLDTGIISTSLNGGDGSYIMTVSYPDTSNGWLPAHTGIFYNYTGTNGETAEEIVLYRQAHSGSDKRIFLRWIQTPNTLGYTKLQIRASGNFTTTYTYTFKFRRMI